MNEFVPIRRDQFVLVSSFLALVGIQSVISCLIAPNSSAAALTFADLLVYLLRAAPIFLFARSYGWFHPVTFSCLYWICRSLPAKVVESIQLYNEGPNALMVTTHDALVGWTPERLTNLAAYASLLTALSFVCYFVGLFLGPRINLRNIVARPAEKVPSKMLAVTGLALASFTVFLKLRGGLEEHLLSWQEGRFEALQGYGVLLHLVALSSIACLIWLALDARAPRQIFFWATVIVSAAMNFIASGSRSQVVYWLFLGILVWMCRERKVLLIRGAAVIASAVLVLGVLGTFRNSITGKGEVDWSTLTNVSAAMSTLTGEDDSQGELVSRGGRQDGLLPILAYVPKEIGLLYGKSYFAVLTLPIPRALWPEKPRTIGALVGETFFDYSTGFAIPPGAIGEAYWNFYIPGIIVIFFLFGVFHRALASWYINSAQTPVHILLYLVILFIGNSPSALAMINTLSVVVPLLIILKICRVI